MLALGELHKNKQGIKEVRQFGAGNIVWCESRPGKA